MQTVLIIEDEQGLVTILKQTLEQYGYKVLAEYNGLAGLDAYYRHKPDIILADIMLPKIDGYMLIQQIRNKDKQVPILCLTAKSQTKDLVKGFDAGCSDYLRKPFIIDELLARMKALLARASLDKPKDQGQRKFKFGRFTFNYTSQQLSSDTLNMQLSYKEAEILKRLVENKNNITEKKAILNELWGDDNFYTARTLNVFITRLRQYLKDDPTIQILNIRGHGFKLVET